MQPFSFFRQCITNQAVRSWELTYWSAKMAVVLEEMPEKSLLLNNGKGLERFKIQTAQLKSLSYLLSK